MHGFVVLNRNLVKSTFSVADKRYIIEKIIVSFIMSLRETRERCEYRSIKPASKRQAQWRYAQKEHACQAGTRCRRREIS